MVLFSRKRNDYLKFLMKLNRLTRIWTCSLGFLLFFNLPTGTLPVLAVFFSETTPVIAQVNAEQILPNLVSAKVIYLGETHNNIEDHQAQLRIIKGLYQQNPKIAIAMEMFQRPYQIILDRYIAGEISEAQLIEQTEYQQRWGFPWENYAEVLRFAQANKLPVLALNTPTEITRKVARQGLESLTNAEQKLIPNSAEIDLNPPEYREMLLKIYQQHHHGGKSNSSDFEKFFLAQVLWDETMADAIANFIKSNPDHQVVVLAGEGHIIYNYGIPSRVQRRLPNLNLIQQSVIFKSKNEELIQNQNSDRPLADFILHH